MKKYSYCLTCQFFSEIYTFCLYIVCSLIELGQKKRAQPSSPFSPWKPGNAAIQSQRKKKPRDMDEKKKEFSKIAKLREAKKTMTNK